MGKFIRDLFCGVDNEHWDIARISAAIALFALMASQVTALVQRQHFDALGFGGGLAAVLGAAGLGISFKDRARTEATKSADA